MTLSVRQWNRKFRNCLSVFSFINHFWLSRVRQLRCLHLWFCAQDCKGNMSQLSLASQRGEIFSEFQPLRGDIFSWATGKMWFIQLHVLWEKKKNWRPRASMSSNGERKCHAVGASDKQSCVVRSNNYWFSQSTQISMLYSPCSGVSICLLKESWKQNLKLPFCSLKHWGKQVLIVQRVSKGQDSDPPHYKF